MLELTIIHGDINRKVASRRYLPALLGACDRRRKPTGCACVYARIGGHRFRVFRTVVRFALGTRMSSYGGVICVSHAHRTRTSKVFDRRKQRMRFVCAPCSGFIPAKCEVRSDDTLNSDKFYCRHCTCSATSALLCRLRCAVVSASRPKCSIVSSVDEVCSQDTSRGMSLRFAAAVLDVKVFFAACVCSEVCRTCALPVQFSCVSAISIQKLHQT